MKILTRMLAVVLIMGWAGTASATLLIDAGPSSSMQGFSTGDYAVGTEFTVSNGITVDGLGWLDAQGDGLLGSHMVGLWNASGQALLASANILTTSGTVLSAQGTAQWFIEAITPLFLSAGTYRVAGIIGTSTNDAAALSNDKIGNGVTLTSGYVRTGFPSGGFNYPSLTFSSQAIRSTVTSGFFDAEPVPAPATLALFGLGLAGLGWSRRKKA